MRVTNKIHQQAEQLLEQGPIDAAGARVLARSVLAAGVTSPETLDLLESLAEHGDERGRKILGRFAANTTRHIRTRAKGCSIIDLRAAQDLRTLAMRDGQLDAGEIRALAELGLNHKFSKSGRMIFDAALMQAPIGSLPAEEKRRLIEKMIGGRGGAIGVDEVARIGWLLEVGGFRVADREQMSALSGLDRFTPEAKTAFDALLARPAIGDPAEWTVLVYMNVDSDAEIMGSDALEQIERAGQKPGVVNVLALVDAGGRLGKDARPGWKEGTRLMWISKDGASRELAVDPKSDLGELLARYRGKVDMSNPHVLRAAATLARGIAPSKHFMVNMLGHGHAWLGMRGFDKPPRSGAYIGNLMNFAAGDLETALKGVGVDVLACNSCLMASQEIARAAERAGVSYLAASESIVPFTGYRYETLLNGVAEMFERNGGVSPGEMAKWVMDSYADAVPTSRIPHGTYSVTDLGQFPELRGRIESFAELLIAEGGLERNEAIRSAYFEGPIFTNPQIDLGVFARSIAVRFKGQPLELAAREVLRAIKKVCASRTNSWPKADQDGRVIPVEKKLDRSGRPRRNQWTGRPSLLPLGISIYGPRDTVNPKYRNPDSPWAGSAWLRFLDGIERRPRTEEEKAATRAAHDAADAARNARRAARGG